MITLLFLTKLFNVRIDIRFSTRIQIPSGYLAMPELSEHKRMEVYSTYVFAVPEVKIKVLKLFAVSLKSAEKLTSLCS